MKKSLKRGFTLIELLVVIAIIGILASIILASLATARSKGNDSKVQEQLKSIQSAAEIYYDTNGSYGTGVACTGMTTDTASGMANLMTASNYYNGVAPACISVAGGSGSYSVSHLLSSGNYFCVDSVGNATTSATATSASHC
jgi:prepilin-type N-terminal cleavage/methylation domain-containing protein